MLGSTSIGLHGRRQLSFLTRWLLLNRVQRPVQDEWQGETRLRFKLRGLSAPPCAQCCAKTRVRCARLSISGCNESAQLMCGLSNHGLCRLPWKFTALWRCLGDGRAFSTHAPLVLERRTIHSDLSVGREESQ